MLKVTTNFLLNGVFQIFNGEHIPIFESTSLPTIDKMWSEQPNRSWFALHGRQMPSLCWGSHTAFIVRKPQCRALHRKLVNSLTLFFFCHTIWCHILLVTCMACFPIASLTKSVVNYWQVLQNLVGFNEMWLPILNRPLIWNCAPSA